MTPYDVKVSNKMFALTSLAPGRSAGAQRVAVESWLTAGLSVQSFNHPSELDKLAPLYKDVSFVTVEKTSIEKFGRHFVPIKAMLDWAVRADVSTLIVNADI